MRWDIVILLEYVIPWFGAATLRARILWHTLLWENGGQNVLFYYVTYFGLFYGRISVNGFFTEDIAVTFIMIP